VVSPAGDADRSRSRTPVSVRLGGDAHRNSVGAASRDCIRGRGRLAAPRLPMYSSCVPRRPPHTTGRVGGTAPCGVPAFPPLRRGLCSEPGYAGEVRMSSVRSRSRGSSPGGGSRSTTPRSPRPGDSPASPRGAIRGRKRAFEGC
jgi:hypothetical protein